MIELQMLHEREREAIKQVNKMILSLGKSVNSLKRSIVALLQEVACISNMPMEKIFEYGDIRKMNSEWEKSVNQQSGSKMVDRELVVIGLITVLGCPLGSLTSLPFFSDSMDGFAVMGMNILLESSMAFQQKKEKERVEDIFRIVSKREIKKYELALVEISERIKRMKVEKNRLAKALIKIRSFGTDCNTYTDEQYYELGVYLHSMKVASMLIVKPILNLQPYLTELDLEEVHKSEIVHEFLQESRRKMFMYLANLLYDIELYDDDMEVLAKILQNSESFLKAVELEKFEFDSDDIRHTTELLAYKYSSNREKVNKLRKTLHQARMTLKSVQQHYE